MKKFLSLIALCGAIGFAAPGWAEEARVEAAPAVATEVKTDAAPAQLCLRHPLPRLWQQWQKPRRKPHPPLRQRRPSTRVITHS
jgi:hypothetical protein